LGSLTRRDHRSAMLTSCLPGRDAGPAALLTRPAARVGSRMASVALTSGPRVVGVGYPEAAGRVRSLPHTPARRVPSPRGRAVHAGTVVGTSGAAARGLSVFRRTPLTRARHPGGSTNLETFQ